MARTGNTADLIPRNLRALRGALENSVTIQVSKLQEAADDLVARGALTRAEADKLVGNLVTNSKAYSQALLQVLDTVSTEARKNVEAGVATAVAPVVSTAGKIADTVRQAPAMVPGMKKQARKPATKPPATAPTSEQASSTTAKKTSKKTAKKSVAEPIARLGELTVSQIRPRLARLSAADLRRVRKTESTGKARKGVLSEIDRLLEK